VIGKMFGNRVLLAMILDDFGNASDAYLLRCLSWKGL
jgi:hypothetical protein